MAALDAAVENGDADALAGGAAPGPLPRDALRPLDGDRDVVGRRSRQAPGWQRLALFLRDRFRLGHGSILCRLELREEGAGALDCGSDPFRVVCGQSLLGGRSRVGSTAGELEDLCEGQVSVAAPAF